MGVLERGLFQFFEIVSPLQSPLEEVHIGFSRSGDGVYSILHIGPKLPVLLCTAMVIGDAQLPLGKVIALVGLQEAVCNTCGTSRQWRVGLGIVAPVLRKPHYQRIVDPGMDPPATVLFAAEFYTEEYRYFHGQLLILHRWVGHCSPAEQGSVLLDAVLVDGIGLAPAIALQSEAKTQLGLFIFFLDEETQVGMMTRLPARRSLCEGSEPTIACT